MCILQEVYDLGEANAPQLDYQNWYRKILTPFGSILVT